LVGSEYIFLDEYINNNTKLRVKHMVCNHEYLVAPTKFIHAGRRCPNCNGGIKKTHEQFVQDVFNLVGDEYQVLGKYINSSTKILMKHNNIYCNNYIYSVTPNDFLTGYRCPKCGGTTKLTNEQFVDLVIEKYNYEYIPLEKYKNQSTKIKMKHNLCGNIWYVKPGNFLYANSKCPYCCGKNLFRNTNVFKREIYDLHGDEYQLLSDFKDVKSKVKILHHECNNIFYVSPNHFLNGSGCPECNKSKGEKAIKLYLINNNIKHEAQVKFDNLLGCGYGKLSYDFYLSDYNLLIEYQGEQHEKYIEGFHKSKRDFYIQQEHDRRKREYAKNNNIKFLEIWYWDFKNIEKILKQQQVC
jgi:hypothetical protein